MVSQPYPQASAPFGGPLATESLLGLAATEPHSTDGFQGFERALSQAIDEKGLLGEALQHHFSANSGLARGRLALDAGKALGLDPSVSTAFAVACELLHSASLVHDDLQDRDTLRRGQLSVWARFGEELAINVGDFLLTRAIEIAAAAPIPPQYALAVIAAFTHATTASIRGQVADNAYTKNPSSDLALYEEIARAKTGPLIALPVQAALAATGLAGSYGKAVEQAFESAAMAYQAQDDIADVLDAKRRVRGSDLRACRPNLVVLMHQRFVDERILARLEAARAFELSRPEILEVLIHNVATSPAIDHAFDYADQLLERSHEAARNLPAMLQPLYEQTAARLTEPLHRLRSEHLEKRSIKNVEIECRSHAHVIPVHT